MTLRDVLGYDAHLFADRKELIVVTMALRDVLGYDYKKIIEGKY